MKVPEKIYAYIPDDDIVGTASTQKGFPHQFVTEEYVRKDALIEKTCEWIEQNNENGGCSFDGWRKDFIKFLESEL